MTCHTLTGRALIAVAMTLGTLQVGMFTNKREARIAVVEGHVAPPARVMTGAAVRAELSIMGILACMTGITIRWSTLVNAICVTGTALNVGMFSRQRESGIVVIESHIAPTAGIVTRSAVRAELTIMLVFRGMTGITILGRPFEHTIGMTGSTLHAGMPARKREAGLVVVKAHVRPLGGLMA